jgi:hypothetical protein
MCIQLALNCVEKDRHKRPDIVTLIQKLCGTENLIDKLIDLQDKVIKILNWHIYHIFIN